MLPTEPQGYVSIIASNFLFPIISLFESLNNLGDSHPPNEVQASPMENGYSLGIITLTVLLVESAVSRTQYIMKITHPKKAVEFIKEQFPDLSEKLEELFVIRDVIAHNHVWEANVFWDENWNLKLLDAQLVEGYGDKKFRNTVDSNARKTKILGLNIFPNKICQSDAVLVLKTAFDFLLSLENRDPNYFSVNALIVKYKTEVMPFKKFMSSIILINLPK